MKLKDSEKSLIFIVLGVAVMALCIVYVAKPKYDNVQSLNSEISQLQNRLTELQGKQAKRDEYLAGIDEFNNAFDDVMGSFPADLNQEVTIMFLQGIKDDNDFTIDSLTLGEKEQFYTLGLNGGDAALASGDGTTTEATSTETATTENTADGTEGELTEGTSVNPDQYTCYRADFPLSYKGSYESLKDVIAYINNFNSRMTINSIDIAYEPDGDVYSGSLDLKCYSIESANRPQSNMELNDVETGVDNIFNGGGSGSGSSESKDLNKYDENDGASIVNNYDFYVMLNPATSDVSAKVAGQNGSGKEATVVSNSDNSVSTMSYEFYAKDGKNYCKYDLDGTSYEAEVTSAEDIKLLIQSSARKDDEDKAGIRISIKNSTDLPVYVKVSDDDATSPRVNIANRSGAVKVY